MGDIVWIASNGQSRAEQYRKAVAGELKRIYSSSTVGEAERELDAFCARWEQKFPSIGSMWRRHWVNRITRSDHSPRIRKLLNTPNAVESLNSVIRESARKRKLFPSDTSALKVVYLATMQASKRWQRPVGDRKNALDSFAIQYEGELELRS